MLLCTRQAHVGSTSTQTELREARTSLSTWGNLHELVHVVAKMQHFHNRFCFACFCEHHVGPWGGFSMRLKCFC